MTGNSAGTKKFGELCTFHSECQTGFCAYSCSRPYYHQPCNPLKMGCGQDKYCHPVNAHCHSLHYEVPALCEGTFDCPWGQYCSNEKGSKCFPMYPTLSSCTEEEACNHESICYKGICRQKCGEVKPCEDGFVCYQDKNTFNFVCVPRDLARDSIIAKPTEQNDATILMVLLGLIIVIIGIVILIYKFIVSRKGKIINDDSDSIDIESPSQPLPGDLPPSVLMDTITDAHNSHASEEPPTYYKVGFTGAVPYSEKSRHGL